MQLLADGLYTAMTTTVAGLIVGILGYISYNHLVVKTNKAVYQMEASSLFFRPFKRAGNEIRGEIKSDQSSTCRR